MVPSSGCYLDKSMKFGSAALARAPAGCQCEHALPPALLTWDPSHTLCRHTKAWPQGSERHGHPLATVVSSGLFPSICLGCIPVLTPAPELLPAPWAETCPGCWMRAGLRGHQAGMGPLLGGEWRLQSGSCSALSQKLGSPLLPSQCGHEHIMRKGLPHTVPATHASQLHPSPSALHPASI